MKIIDCNLQKVQTLIKCITYYLQEACLKTDMLGSQTSNDPSETDFVIPWTILRICCKYLGGIILPKCFETWTVPSALAFEVRMIAVAPVQDKLLCLLWNSGL